MTANSDPVADAFIDAARCSQPGDRTVATLLVAGRVDQAIGVARSWLASTADPEPLVAAIVAAIGRLVDEPVEAEAISLLDRISAHSSDAGRTGILCRVLEAITSSNDRAAESVCDQVDTPVAQLAARAARAVSRGASPPPEFADGALDELPTLLALTAAASPAPGDVARRLGARGQQDLPTLLHLFRSGRPDLALVQSRARAHHDPFAACCWWLAAVQSGILVRELDAIVAATAHAPEVAAALVAESETVLGHRTAPDLDPSFDAAWAAAIERRRRGRGPRVARAWAIASHADLGRHELAATVDRARAHMQRGEWDDAARNLASAAERGRSPRETAALLAAAAAACSIARESSDYAQRYLDRALATDPESLVVTTTALWVRHLPEHRSGNVALLRRLEAIADRHATNDEDHDAWAHAADVYARGLGSNAAALTLLERAVDADPTSTARWLALADFRERIGDFTQAALEREEAARSATDPERRAAIYAEVGDLYLDVLGQRLPALENYLVSFLCWAGSARTLQRLETLCAQLGRNKDLVGAYDLAIEFARRNPTKTEIGVEELLRRRSALG